MANVLVNESSLQDIADAIRDKLSVETTYKPSEMAAAIGTIGSGITPAGTKQISITENGTTTEDVTSYASAEITVNVPSGGGGGFSTGAYTPEANANSWNIDVGGDYDHFVIYANTDSAGQGVRAIRTIICDFTQDSNNLLVITTNNTGSGIQGFYYTTGYVTKNGSVMTYSSSVNYFPVGITYTWIAW